MQDDNLTTVLSGSGSGNLAPRLLLELFVTFLRSLLRVVWQVIFSSWGGTSTHLHCLAMSLSTWPVCLNGWYRLSGTHISARAQGLPTLDCKNDDRFYSPIRAFNAAANGWTCARINHRILSKIQQLYKKHLSVLLIFCSVVHLVQEP